MDTSLYYLFSTIAQTLAAGIAILGAFALYRLQAMNSEIAERSSTIAQFASGARGLVVREAHVHGKFHEVLDATEDVDPGMTAELNYQVSAARVRLATLLAQRRSLRRYFSISFWLSGGLLTSSLIVLATVPEINAVRGGAATAEVVGITWFVLCIGTYAELIWSALT